MELTYTKHISNTGATYTIASVADVFPNEGGLYCEIYDDNTDDVIDNFVIHFGENPNDIAQKYMKEFYN